MNPTGESRKVGQLRNDVDDIYDMLGGINATLADHTATLADHTATLADHTATLDQHTLTLAEHGSKLDQIIEILETR